MSVVLNCVVCYAARERWSRRDVSATDGGHAVFSYFKIGEGGWELSGDVSVPRSPDPNLEDLDCIEHPLRYPEDSRYYFRKNFVESDLVFEGARTALARCVVDFDESNDDGHGNSPGFCEIGIFDAEDVMVLYGTFTIETKTGAIQLKKEVRLTR